MTNDDKEKIKEFIHRRRRQLVLHSMVYYRYNRNLIADATWDEWANELKNIQEKHPTLSAEVSYLYSSFKDWDAITGYDLYDGRLVSVVERLL